MKDQRNELPNDRFYQTTANFKEIRNPILDPKHQGPLSARGYGEKGISTTPGIRFAGNKDDTTIIALK